ncbi:MAG: hypothetical protein Q8Q14_00485 [Gemmatimonadales bacterium]|nr:hypothetical protein [Gemmatimonadales bacterium]
MTWREVTDGLTAWRFLLTVGGLSVRYYSVGDPRRTDWPTPLVPGTAIIYTDREAITEVSAQTAELDPSLGFMSDSGVTVTLASRGDLTDASDPLTQLMRVGNRGATLDALLITSIPHSAVIPGGVIEVDRDVSGWGFPRLIHIGREAFWVDGAAGTGAFGDPYRFNYVSRAAAGTRHHAHKVNAEQGWQPHVTGEVVHWRTRPATLRVANERDSGGLSDAVDVVRGFIGLSPQLADDGLSVTLYIQPWRALLTGTFGGDVQNGADAVAELAQGYHVFDGESALTVEHVQEYPAGRVFATSIVGALATGAGNPFINVQGSIRARVEGVFDSGGALPAGHPRKGLIDVDGHAEPYEITGTVIGPPSQILINPPLAAPGVLDNDGLSNPDLRESIQADVVPAGAVSLVDWPNGAIQAINAATGWTPGTYLGTAGQWADVKIVADGATPRPALMARLNTDYPAPVDLRFSAGSGPGMYVWGDRRLWYPLDFARPDDERRYDARPSDISGRSHQEDAEGEWTRTEWVTKRRDRGEWDRYEIRGIADTFYQTGETYILLSADVLDLTAVPQRLEAVWYEGGEEKRGSFRVVSSAQEFAGPTLVGYRYEVARADRELAPSMGDWPGEKRATFTPIVEFREEDPRRIMLRLLYSGQGTLTNHAAYDVLPFGFNLTDDDVDLGSFWDFPIPVELTKWSLDVRAGDTGEDVLGPMARVLGGVLASRVDPTTGTRRIAFVSTGLDNARDAVTSIGAGDWSGIVASGTDERVFNRYVFEMNHDPATGDPGLKVAFNDRDSIGETGESRELELALRGLHVPADSPEAARRVLAPAFEQLRIQFGQPRRLWKGRIWTGDALLIDPGCVVLLSATDAVDAAGRRGITNAPARVLLVTHDWREGISEIHATTYGINGSGWAPALRVAVSTSPNVVIVEANYYTRNRHPITGAVQTDVQHFAVNDAVACIPVGNFAARVQTTITSIVGNVVTFAAPHGLSIGDTIRPRAYDVASSAHQAFAYGADAAGTLGAAADPAYDID